MVLYDFQLYIKGLRFEIYNKIINRIRNNEKHKTFKVRMYIFNPMMYK